MLSDLAHRVFHRAAIELQQQQPKRNQIRSLPELVEFNAKFNSSYPFCVQFRSTKDGVNGASVDGSQSITISHSVFKNSIQSCSTYLLKSVKELALPARDDGVVRKGAPIALFVESDVGLLIYKLSLMGLGVPVLLLSARLSPTAVHHLVSKTGTRVIIVAPRLEHIAREALCMFSDGGYPAACSLYLQAPYETFTSAPDTPQDTSIKSICTEEHYIGDHDCNVLILHSSGTTGLPKPIYTSHRHMLSFTNCHNFSSNKEAQALSLSTLPLFHGFGLVTPCLSLGVGMTFCIGPPSVIPTGTSVAEMLRKTGACSLLSVPSILEELSLLPDDLGIRALAHLRFVAFGGGLLKPSVGEKLAAGGVRLVNHYGTTESGPLAPIFSPGEEYDWRFFRLRKDIKLTLKIKGLVDGVERFALTAFPFGWESEFLIKDELITSPRNPMVDFNAIGRTDDLIVLATGEKVLPNILETMLSENELVKAAIAFGDGQFEIGLLVVPSLPLPREKYGQFKDLIWPTIVHAGTRMDAQAQISSKAALVIVPHTTNFPRSDKGSVLRREVYQVFEEEIASAYQDLETAVSDDFDDLFCAGSLEEILKSFIQNGLKWRIPANAWACPDDLFELGMDSLQAVRLRRFLLQILPKLANRTSKVKHINRNFVYQFPSITQMANALRNVLDPPEALPLGSSLLDDYVNVYSINNAPLPAKGLFILLTGSTGSLGVHLLAHLASLPNVERIVCLNRLRAHGSLSKKDPARHHELIRSKDIILSAPVWEKIEFIECNMALPMLGLSEAKYAEIYSSVTHILHNAWPMDFKRRLPSFENQFKALRNLLELGLNAHKMRPKIKPRLIFVSSIAVVGQYPRVQNEAIVPEIPVLEKTWTNDIGYAEAKLVCERILENTAYNHAAQIEVASVRIGQMSGSRKNGSWNTSEHLAALIKSSQLIKCFPKLQGTLSWIPVDSAAASLSDILLSGSPLRSIYHLENPVRQPWQETLSIIASHLDITAPPLEFDLWLAEVAKVPEGASSQNPAGKLLEFFKSDFIHMACGNVVLDTSNSRQVSPTLRAVKAVDKEVLLSYIRYWRNMGFLA